MIYWKKIPFVKLLLPLLVGIIPAIYLDLSWFNIIYPLGGLSVILAGLQFLFPSKTSLNRELFFSIILNLALVLGGAALVIFNTSANYDNYYGNYSADLYKIKISSTPKVKPNSFQLEAEVTAVKVNGKWVNTQGKLLVYLAKETESAKVLESDVLLVKTNPSVIKEASNPNQFSYKRYLKFNQIRYQTYIPQQDWIFYSTDGSSITGLAAKARKKMLHLLKESGLSGNELAVASALILGYKDDLDASLKHSYSSAGATHVLAVSGLHVGIIFLVLNTGLKFMNRFKSLRWLRLILILLVLWSYALITGLSPSVMRAAMMFSFVAVGTELKFITSIYNTLATSAFVLLCYNPYLIMEVGFQLSYLAVVGIVFFQPKIYKLFIPENIILDYLWKITAVSIAAQLSTFPLGLLYFHQFPVYFLVSNIAVINGAFIIMALGLSLLALSFIKPLFIVFGLILNGVVYSMNWLVLKIDKLPYALLEGIDISILETWLIYGMIVMMAIVIERQRFSALLMGLVFTIALLVYDFYEDARLKYKASIVIYDIKDHPNLNFIDYSNNVFIASKDLTEDRSTLLFNVMHNWYAKDHTTAETFDFNVQVDKNEIYGKHKCYWMHGVKVKMLTAENAPLETDICYIVDNFDTTHVNSREIVLGNDLNAYHRTAWKSYAKQHNILLHDIIESGAFVKDVSLK